MFRAFAIPDVQPANQQPANQRTALPAWIGQLTRPRSTTVRAIVPTLTALLTAVAVAEVGVEGPVASVAWLALGPLVASLLLTARWTALVGGYALLLGVLVVANRPGSATTGTVQLLVLAGLSIFAVGNCLLRESRERHLRDVIRVAQVAQAAILRPVPARNSRLRFGSRYRSADRRADVGGDIVDVQLTARGARALVADADGQGLAAVPLAAIVLASFREACARPGLSLVEVARAVDQAVELLAPDGQSATAVFLDLDDRGWVELVTCGHPPPLRRDAAGRVSNLSPDQHAMPLGRSPRLRSDTFTLTPGDRLVVYTDGVLLDSDRNGAPVPLAVQVGQLTVADSSAAAGQLLAGALRHDAGQRHNITLEDSNSDDDATVLIIDVDPADSPLPAPSSTAPNAPDSAATDPTVNVDVVKVQPWR